MKACYVRLRKPADRPPETVLVAEDAAAVRAVVQQMLTSHGYKVLGPRTVALRSNSALGMRDRCTSSSPTSSYRK